MTPDQRIVGLLALARKNAEERAKLASGKNPRGSWDAHEGEVDNLMACGGQDCCSGGLEDALCNEDCSDCVEFARLFHENGNELQTYLEPL